MVVFILFLFLFSSFSWSKVNIYFTNPPNSLSNFSTEKKSIDFALKDFILSATAGTTVYVCIYSINNSTITTAIDDVVNKGVKVYAIFDQNVSTNVFKSSFEWKKLGSTSQLMHNKFVVLKSSKVWTGSYNFTVSATYEQDNFVLEIFSKDLAEIYEKAFWYMWDSTGNISEFNAKSVTFPDGTKITVYFNPYSQNPELKDVLVENWYNKADEEVKIKNLYFAVTWFNCESITNCLKLLKNKNVNVYGIIDDDIINIAVIQDLKREGISIYFDDRKTFYGGGLMHHKFCVSDPYGENPKVICGSANWTQTALTYDGNYENLVVIESREVAEVFYQEFLRLYNKAVSQWITPVSDELVEEILFYPNPTKEKLNIKFKPNMEVKEIKFLLVSLYGVKVFEQNLNFVCGVENKIDIQIPSVEVGLYYAILRTKTTGYSKDYVKKIIIK